MDKETVQVLYTEEIVPPKRIIKSDFLFFVLVAVLVIAVILIASIVQVMFEIPRIFLQIFLYAFLCLYAVWLYKKRLVVYRYKLTERMFSVERVIGKRSRPDHQIHLTDIVRIGPYEKLSRDTADKQYKAFHGSMESTTALLYKNGKKTDMLLISPSQKMQESILKQWKKSRR